MKFSSQCGGRWHIIVGCQITGADDVAAAAAKQIDQLRAVS